MIFYAEAMELIATGEPQAREKLRKLLTQEDTVVPGAPRKPREIAEVPGVPVPDWWDDDHDPFADQWEI